MNKQDIIDLMASSAGITKVAAEKALTTFTETITGTLKEKGKVSIAGFGSFETSERAAREGINPQTLKRISISASTVPKFKASKALKEAINKRDEA